MEENREWCPALETGKLGPQKQRAQIAHRQHSPEFVACGSWTMKTCDCCL